jgi:HSP20 family molecular chaperone IbpA
MSNFFDDFERDFAKLFKLSFSNFNRPVKDMQPYKLIKTENGYILILNTLGVSKNDLSVKIGKEKGDPYAHLRVSGKTVMEKFQLENNVDLSIRLIIDEEIEDVVYEVKDGLTVVYLKLKKKEPEVKIEAKYIDEDFDF